LLKRVFRSDVEKVGEGRYLFSNQRVGIGGNGSVNYFQPFSSVFVKDIHDLTMFEIIPHNKNGFNVYRKEQIF